MLTTPVLFLIFNRPEPTRKVFEAIRKAGPARLFIAADGPRRDRPEDVEGCAQARAILDKVDWDCEVVTLFREGNLGCRKAVSSALDWFFEHVAEGIVLEDDCLPSASFFLYCSELLERYRDDARVMAISGDYYQDGRKVTKDSYYFSRYPHCWGWASWRRSWKKYDAQMSSWPASRAQGLLAQLSGKDKLFMRYWENIFDKVHAGGIDSWAYVWTYSCWVSGGLTALPAKNLVKNIGFGCDATHTVLESEKYTALQAEELEWPLVHPSEVTRHKAADLYTDMYHFGIGPERAVPLVHRAISRVMTPLRKCLALSGRGK
jgi:hypothetical protein